MEATITPSTNNNERASSPKELKVEALSVDEKSSLLFNVSALSVGSQMKEWA